MGTHPKVINPKDMISSIRNFAFPEHILGGKDNPLQKLDIELRMQVIRVVPKEELDWKTAPRAAHVYVALKTYRKAFSHFIKIFSKFNKIGFPLGQEIYFVPNTMDSRIVTTKDRLCNVKKMRERQQKWLEKMNIIPTYTIAGIDLETKVTTQERPEEKTSMTLRQAVMGLKSIKQTDRNLFRAVDQNSREGRVYFLVNEKMESEARSIVMVLPLIFQEKYGPRIWTWFFKSAVDVVVGYTWTENDGVVAEEDEVLQETFASQTGLDEDDFKLEKGTCRVKFAKTVRTPNHSGN